MNCMLKFRVEIDDNVCQGCGECFELCPEFFQRPNIDAEMLELDKLDCVKEAAEFCPFHAIHIINIETGKKLVQICDAFGMMRSLGVSAICQLALIFRFVLSFSKLYIILNIYNLFRIFPISIANKILYFILNYFCFSIISSFHSQLFMGF